MSASHMAKLQACISGSYDASADTLLIGASHFAPNHLKGLPKNITVAAIGGYTAAQAVDQFQELVDELSSRAKPISDFTWIVLCFGGNDYDVLRGELPPTSAVERSLRSLIGKVKAAAPYSAVAFARIALRGEWHR